MADKVEQVVDPMRIYVVGGGQAYIRMFYEAGFRGATGIDDADVVVFTGGEDVDPALYKERPLQGTHFNTVRDDRESEIFKTAFMANLPMIGICRGAQFLNVMSGGKLWQHVDHHAVYGGHAIQDLISGDMIPDMTSTHHQQMIPGEDGEIIALACESLEKLSEGVHVTRPTPEMDDVEVVWYPNTRCLCFQPHPEYNEGDCRNYFMDLVDHFICSETVDEDEDTSDSEKEDT